MRSAKPSPFWNCRLCWSNGIIAVSMSRISLFAKGISRNDAIGVGVLGGVLGVVLLTSGESAVSGWLLSAGVGLLVGGALGALVGALFRGFGGVAFGLIGGVLVGASTGEF